MFEKVSKESDKTNLIENYLSARKKLKERFLAQKLAKQDATVDFETQFKPLLDPTQKTLENVQQIKPEIQKATDAISKLPGEISRVTIHDIDEELDTQKSELESRIKEENPVEIAKEGPPEFWIEWMKRNTTYHGEKIEERWLPFVWVTFSGARTATGKEYTKFRRDVLGEPKPRPKRSGGGEIKYFSSPLELMTRLETLAASFHAGNTSLELRNEAFNMLDRLLEDDQIDKDLFQDLFSLFNRKPNHGNDSTFAPN